MPSPGLAQPAGEWHGQEGFWAQGRGRGNSEKAAWTGGGGQRVAIWTAGTADWGSPAMEGRREQ